MKFLDFSKAGISQHGAISTIIGQETKIKGTIDTKESVRLDGSFEGTISAEGEVFIADGASIKGNVFGRRVVIVGEVRGDVSASESVEIRKKGNVFGNISSSKLIVDEGASYKGRVTMGEIKEEKKEEQFSDQVKELIGF